MSGGSPGGALIIHFTAKTLYGVLNWGLNAAAGHRPAELRLAQRPELLEEKRFPPATVEALRARGAEVREQEHDQRPAGDPAAGARQPCWFGGADPRREGVVMGD